jgi:hypothetical protein
LESVIRRDPNHKGAIYYYIHSVEASSSPKRALAAAQRLPQLAPGAGHLVHMPAHVYMRTGDYQGSVATSQKAAAADEAYIRATGAQGMYPAMYYSHNLHFIAVSAATDGNYLASRKAADQLAAHVKLYLKEMPSLEAFSTIPLAVDVRFHRWDDILQMQPPGAQFPMTTFFYHFARAWR